MTGVLGIAVYLIPVIALLAAFGIVIAGVFLVLPRLFDASAHPGGRKRADLHRVRAARH